MGPTHTNRAEQKEGVVRLFQNSALYPSYRSRHSNGCRGIPTFKAQSAYFLDHRYGALHFLAPVLNGDATAFFTNGDDEGLQRAWANEMGMRAGVSLVEILLAQVESHGTEVFYNLDPLRYGNGFVHRLPGCVRKTVAWCAAPSPGADLNEYDLVVCNFPSLLKHYQEQGWKAEYFAPAHDPVMDEYAENGDRSIDVLFVGGYSRHHRRRAAVLEAVAGLRGRYRIEFCLGRSRLTRMAESPVGYFAFLQRDRRPRAVRAVSREPVYGRDLYALLSRAKIVLNGAIDMSGEDRGNMRCFEAMGCSALLLSDAGFYPPGMRDGETLLAYSSPSQACAWVEEVLSDWGRYAEMARYAHGMVRSLYSKEHQWHEFNRLVNLL
jgi:Glycosyl transferases group 1